MRCIACTGRRHGSNRGILSIDQGFPPLPSGPLPNALTEPFQATTFSEEDSSSCGGKTPSQKWELQRPYRPNFSSRIPAYILR